MPAFPQSKAARLAQLDKEIVERFQQIAKLIKPGDDQCCYYLSNLRTVGDSSDMTAAAVGNSAVIAAHLVMHSLSNPAILEALPQAREAIAKHSGSN